MKYSLIKIGNTYSLVEGISRYTPYTSFYEVVNGTDIESFKEFLIESRNNGDIVNLPEIKSILKNKKLETNTIL